MPFRNPLRTLPASALTGQITTGQIAAGAVGSTQLGTGSVIGSKIQADAIDGMTITGAVLRAVTPGGALSAVMANDVGDGNPGVRSYTSAGTAYAELVGGGVQFGAAGLTPYEPTEIYGSVSGAEMDVSSGSLSSTQNSARILLQGGTVSPLGGPQITLLEDGNAFVDLYVYVDGVLQPRSMAWGTVTITSGSSTTVSTTVSGLALSGTHFRGYVTVESGAPSAIVGCTINNVTSAGATIWLCRSGTAVATNVYYTIVGSAT